MGKIYRTDASGNPTLIMESGVVDTTRSTTSTNPRTNALTTQEIDSINENLIDLKMLGWSVPADCPIQNSVSGNTFTQNVDRIELGALTWTKYSPGLACTYFATIPLKRTGLNIYCAEYTTSYTGIVTNLNDKEVSGRSSDNIVFIRDTSCTDATSFKTAMSGVYLYYELATPITMTIDGNEVVSEIKNDLLYNANRNILNPNIYTTGLFYSESEKSFVENIYWNFRQEPLYVDAGKYLTYSCKTCSGQIAIVEFNSSGEFIKFSAADTRSSGSQPVITIQTNSNTAYVCYGWRNDIDGNNEELMISYSSGFKDYIEYGGDSNKMLTEDVSAINSSLGGLSFSASGTTLTITDGTNTWTLNA